MLVKVGAGDTLVVGCVDVLYFQPMVPPLDPVTTMKYVVDGLRAWVELALKSVSAQAPTDVPVSRSVTFVPG